jgi:predicted TIM-barrel fold metal-dependent hydrolase
MPHSTAPAGSRGPIVNLPRRDWLKRGALALGTALTGLDARRYVSGQQDDAGTAPRRAIDAHVHVWTSDLDRYPLAAGFTRESMRPASFTPEELFAHARPAGVGRVVLIQMSYYGFDNRYMLDAIRDHAGVFAGVAVIDEHAAGVGETMRKLKQQGVRGFRIHPGTEAVDRWLFHPNMTALWRLAASEQLAMCALVNPEALEPLDAMCQKHPRTPLVIDHFARIGIDGTIRDADVQKLCRLARHPLVHVKVSAFYALGKKKPPYSDLGPMIKRLLGAFGRERLMWASDCPFQIENGHTYADSIELVRSRLDFLTPDDRRWLLEKTAEKVYFH